MVWPSRYVDNISELHVRKWTHVSYSMSCMQTQLEYDVDQKDISPLLLITAHEPQKAYFRDILRAQLSQEYTLIPHYIRVCVLEPRPLNICVFLAVHTRPDVQQVRLRQLAEAVRRCNGLASNQQRWQHAYGGGH